MNKEVSNKKKITDKKLIIIFLVGVAILLATIAIVVHFSTKVTNDSYIDCAIGDVDGNGFINSGDNLLIQKHLNGTGELFESQQKNGDVNLDGKLDKLDMELIQMYATGQIAKLPYTGKEDKTENRKENAVDFKDEKVESSVQIENSWSNGDGTYSYQLKVTMDNIDDSKLRNWETKVKLSEKAKII
ncbi:MAG: dockerin type I repeat-containing protein, partial [Acutalibacteraceae bacterium]|nr:dockerin type I repeat-containing protein [Acutalibacteraceae bacterium]